MCVYSKTWIPKIAIKDIKVYKVVKQEGTELVTPYLNYKVSKIIKTSFKEYIKTIFNMRYDKLLQRYSITSGFIHSYKNTLDARFMIANLLLCHFDNAKYKLVKGVIPKGSIYYEDKVTYCSNKLILDL